MRSNDVIYCASEKAMELPATPPIPQVVADQDSIFKYLPNNLKMLDSQKMQLKVSEIFDEFCF